MNKTGKAKVHITDSDNQSMNSCHEVASDHKFTFGSAIEPTKKKHNALWLCTIHGHLLQPNLVPLQSRCTCQHVCLLCWPEAQISLGNNSTFSGLVRGTMKTMGHKWDHQNRISIGPRFWWGLKQSVFWDFKRSMTGNRQKCASLKQFKYSIHAKNKNKPTKNPKLDSKCDHLK